MNLEAIDIVFIVLIFIFALSGFKKGFFSQLFTIIGLVLGLFFAYFFSDELSEKLVNLIGDGKWNNLISFTLILIIVLIIFKLLNKAFKESLEALGVQGMDKIFGFLFGAVQGVIICIGITACITFQSYLDPGDILYESTLGSIFSDFLPKIEKILPQTKEFVETLEKEI